MVLELDPGNVRAERDLRNYQIGSGQLTSDDPAIDALIRAREAGLGTTLEPGDPRRSLEILEEAIETSRALGARRTYLTHLTHRVTHAELEERLPEGVYPAFDGLTVEID